ncbi:hypothetical protein EKL32_02740 [Flavobacterium sp. GSN2]|nr:hypothetical protein EKL32_02740 [Flavobacterium sp. GSN2]
MKTNKQTNEIKQKVLVLFMSFSLCFMQSCSMEDLVIEQQLTIETVSKSEAVSFVKNRYDEQRTTAKSSGLQNDFDFDKITQEKLTNTTELLTVIPIKTKAQQQRRRALFLRVGSQIESMIYHEFAESSFTNDTFSGIVLMTRLNGDFIRAYRLKNNKYVVDLAPNKKNQSGQKGTQNTSRTIDGGDLHEVIVINSYKDPSAFVSLNEMGKEVPITISWNSLGSGGDPNPSDNEELEFKINSDELNGKAKCINDLLNKKDSSYVKNLLSNFQGESEFDIKIVSQDVIISNVSGKPINGSTTEPVNSVIVIKISTSQANLNPNLVVARTILHEYIHADIFRKLKTNDTSLPQIQDFKKIFELYADNLDKDHSAMADLYINSMLAALKEFHKMQLPNDYDAYINYYGEEPNDAFYEALAWVGLKDNNVDAWVKLPEAKKEEINNMGSRIDKLGKISPCTN